MFNKMNITPTSIAILAQLAEDPMKEFYQREIAEKAQVSLGSANQLLRDLVKREMVILERRGKMLFYRINLDNSVSRHFKILFNVMYLDELVKELRNACKRMILFGSCAEGTDMKESDIDIFVLTQKKDVVIQTINKYERRINRRIAPIVLSSIEWASMRRKDRPLYDSISRGIILWQGE
jgi:predicted nucleotidyltransferase